MSGILVPIAAQTPRSQSKANRAAENGRFAETNREYDLGLTRREIKNPPCQRVQEGSQKLLRISTCSLAVFYVEQVALNRHVSPQQAAPLLMTSAQSIVNSIS